ncbi:MAG: V4R domain-containing protein [Gemmobacter sp.]
MTFLERLRHDPASGAHFDETRRYMMIRPEALMGIFRRLPAEGRAAALDALGASIFEMGSDSARAYAAMGGGGLALAQTVARTAPELGWGVWTMDAAPDRLQLTVASSPFAAGFGPSDTPVCHAIAGMLRAVGGLVFGRPAMAHEIACAACGAPACTFEALPQ